MLRLSNTVLARVAAATLLASSAAFAQGGLGGRLTDAGTKLDQDVQACRLVNLGEYAQLLHEAAANKQRAEKMKKKGIPVDETQVNADLANASALFNRAQAALVGQCMRAAQQQQPRTTGALPGGSTPTVGLAGGGQSCTPAATPAAAASGGPRIPTEDEIRHIGDQMETAAEAGKQSEADYHLRSLDELGAQLSKTISDAKKVGEFSNLDVKEAQKRLKQIEDWRKAGEKHRLPCPAKPKSTALNLDNWARDVFAAHNVARNAVGSPPLQWRDDLAEHAQARAAELAQAQQLVHAPREGRGTERENILQAPRGYTAAQEMGRWTREASDFVPGKFPDVSRTGNWMDVAHYTQMVSIQTTHIGCGHAMGGGFDWVVCRYDPGGNKDGKPILADANTQPQLVMREKEAPLPPTDTSRVHQTPMAQPQGDRSAARMVAEDVRHPWNEQKPMTPVSQPMTPPPESILDDVGQTSAPPESILDDFADANSTIRPRLVGGDYGNQTCEGPPVDAIGAIRANTADCGEEVIKPIIDLAGDITGHGNDDEFWGGSAGILTNLSEDTRLELGVAHEDYDAPTAGSVGGGIYWDPVSQVTIGAGATYVEIDSGPGEWPDIVGDLRWDQAWGTIQAAGAAKGLLDPSMVRYNNRWNNNWNSSIYGGWGSSSPVVEQMILFGASGEAPLPLPEPTVIDLIVPPDLWGIPQIFGLPPPRSEPLPVM